MLTKGDLKAIENAVDERLDAKLKPIGRGVQLLQKNLATVKKDVRKIRKDLDGSILLSDKWQIYLAKRITKTEDELGIPTPEFATGQI